MSDVVALYRCCQHCEYGEGGTPCRKDENHTDEPCFPECDAGEPFAESQRLVLLPGCVVVTPDEMKAFQEALVAADYAVAYPCRDYNDKYYDARAALPLWAVTP